MSRHSRILFGLEIPFLSMHIFSRDSEQLLSVRYFLVALETSMGKWQSYVEILKTKVRKADCGDIAIDFLLLFRNIGASALQVSLKCKLRAAYNKNAYRVFPFIEIRED